MRRCPSLFVLALALAVPLSASTLVGKPPDGGEGWAPLSPIGGSYVYADTFVAPDGDTRPLKLGCWLRLVNAPSPSVRFEVWADAAGGPDASKVLATTGSIAPATDGVLTYFEAPVAGAPARLTPGERYWFVLTVVGEPVPALLPGLGGPPISLQVGYHTQNSVYPDNAFFLASNDPAGALFDFGPTLPEMAFQVELGPKILLLNISCGGSVSQFANALWALGETGVTEAFDEATFLAALTDGTAWDLVLVEAYDNFLSPGTETALLAYVAAGGRAAVNHFYLASNPDLVAALGATVVGSYTSPLPIYAWDPTEPFFSTPNALSDPVVPGLDFCGQDGLVFEPTARGHALAGYSPAPEPNAAAIVLGNLGRTLLLGEVLATFDAPSFDSLPPVPEGLSIAENALHQLLVTHVFGDGFEIETSCRWGATTPIFAEVCNGLDDNCDGTVDEGDPEGGQACDTSVPGECAPGLTLCGIGGAVVCDQLVFPSAELCNGLDDNCDGTIDDGNPESGAACDTGLFGLCQSGLTSCEAAGNLACLQTVFPEDESLNCFDGLDNDCDGAIDCDDVDCQFEPTLASVPCGPGSV